FAFEALLADHRCHIATALAGVEEDFEQHALERSDTPALAICGNLQFFPRAMPLARPEFLGPTGRIGPVRRKFEGGFAILRVAQRREAPHPAGESDELE